VTSLGLAQCGAAVAIATAALLSAPLVCRLLNNPKLLAPWLAMGVAVLFVHGQEFCRRVLYAKLRLLRVFFLDVVYCGLQVAGFYLLWKLGGGQWEPSNAGWLSGRNAMLVTAAAAVAGLLVGLLQIRGYFEYARDAVLGAIGDNWRLGKPGLGGLLGETFHTQGTLAVVNLMTGAMGTALVEAPRLLLAPLNILHFAGVNVLTPRAAEQIARHGRASLTRQIPRLAALWLIPFAGYPLLVLAAPGLWLNVVYGGKWDHAVGMVQLWALGQCVAGLRVFPWILVNALMRPDLYMRGSVVTGLLSLAASPVMISHMGAGGVLVARLAGDGMMLAWGAIAAAQLLSEEPDEPVAAEGNANA
jgi:O-antigen/teichoic acid export membrane protein